MFTFGEPFKVLDLKSLTVSYLSIWDDTDVTGGYRLFVRDRLDSDEVFDYWFENITDLQAHINTYYSMATF